MKHCILILMITIITLYPVKSFSQEKKIYKHPLLNFQFAGSGDWTRINHTEDNLIYEMVSPDKFLHVMLWYTETEQNAEKYLVKMSDMKGFDLTNNYPSLFKIDDKESRILRSSGIIAGRQVTTLLSVTASGRVLERPKENKLYIVQIWCEKDMYSEVSNLFDEILSSVEIN